MRSRHGPLSAVVTLTALMAAGCGDLLTQLSQPLAWNRHTIDARFVGADGVKPGPPGDGRPPDLVAAWEESGVVIAYLAAPNPGYGEPETAGAAGWTPVTVGRVGSVEDAVFVDLDDDGRLDVVTCAEGAVKSVFIHWGPSNPTLTEEWQTEAIPAVQGRYKWMFCQPAQIDGAHGVDLIVGAKGHPGAIGYLAAPPNPRRLAEWTWHPLAETHWVMSIIPTDLDRDGDVDILYTDRKGQARGAYWLENPAGEVLPVWSRHLIGSAAGEPMFADLGDLDGDDLPDLVVATNRHELRRFEPVAGLTAPWLATTIPWPESFGTGKGVQIADLNDDGTPEIVFSCENAGGRSGVGYLEHLGDDPAGLWLAHRIADEAGAKFDIVSAADADGDGDLDIFTTEESSNLGVIWYENPR